MNRISKFSLIIFTQFLLSVSLYAQREVTRFLGIPVDGSKSEMIEKLKNKGYTINQYANNILEGEFNGRDVLIVIVTNNNKVWRIGVRDLNETDEVNIRNRFNDLLQQFQHNKNYVSPSDSIIAKWIIPDNEDISYEMSVHKKTYQATFYQITPTYDSLVFKQNELKEKLDKGQTFDNNYILELAQKQIEVLRNFIDNNHVWFDIGRNSGKYYITIFYDNEYNRANGDDL